MGYEPNERLVRGPAGPQGRRGEQGMDRASRRAIVFLVLLTLVLAGLNLFATFHYFNASTAHQCAVVSTVEATHPAQLADLRAVLGCRQE